MNKNRKAVRKFVIALLCYTIVIAGVFYFIGRKAAYNHAEDLQTFYATISDIDHNTFTVKGMEINDINFRGRFSFSITTETRITWRYTDVSIDDLDVGDNIAITFTGEMLETDPVQIKQVKGIQLLDDEK